MNGHMTIDGIDRLSVSFLTLQYLSYDQIWDIIAPAAAGLQEKMQQTISSLFHEKTGALRESIELRRMRKKDDVVYAWVGPNQKKHPKSSTGTRKPRDSKKGGGGGSYAGTNAEVGWILEYGSARIPAKHWMEQSCNDYEEEIYRQIEEGFRAACEAAGF